MVCHLGHGCSASAVRGGKCVDTTMGFTPLAGLMMATRSGSIDPSIVLHVQQHHGLTPAQVETALNRESGLLGVSGLSADMRQVLAAAKGGHGQARLALGIYAHRVRQAIGALAVTMGGVDALVFTAGVGEHSLGPPKSRRPSVPGSSAWDWSWMPRPTPPVTQMRTLLSACSAWPHPHHRHAGRHHDVARSHASALPPPFFFQRANRGSGGE